VHSVVVTAARTARALPPDDLARRASRIAAELASGDGRPPVAVTVVADPDEAISTALERARPVVVAGSIFLVGAVHEGLRRRAILQ
jgi:folylpolyglutamate synthase/dihydropteroate synthase